MKFTALFASLFAAQLTSCLSFELIKDYDCKDSGIPTVAIIARQGSDLPSVEFFLPMFTDCSAAERRIPAKFTPGSLFYCASMITYSLAIRAYCSRQHHSRLSKFSCRNGNWRPNWIYGNFTGTRTPKILSTRISKLFSFP
jgi:hypothetical protein